MIVTTEAVLWEWLNAFSGPSTRSVASEGLPPGPCGRAYRGGAFQHELVDSAVQLYRTRPDKSWSLTDCLSFLVMERRQLTQALTTDRHFEQAGLKALMLQQPAP